jgi:two-component system phosphate regulon response regulator PhoB
MHATQTSKKIIIVDRDVTAIEDLRQKLCDEGFAVRAITDAAAAVVAMATTPPHLVIVDWNMPGHSALTLMKSIRSIRGPQPVRMIILSTLSGEHDVVAGLDLGADDYIAKPYSLREVVARVSAVLRAHGGLLKSPELCGGHLTLDSSSNRVTAHGRLVQLRAVEYRLLEFLMSHPGRTFNRAQLLARIWGADSDVDERTVDVNVQRLRKLLADSGCESYLQTVRGFGYRFSVPVAAPPQ